MVLSLFSPPLKSEPATGLYFSCPLEVRPCRNTFHNNAGVRLQVYAPSPETQDVLLFNSAGVRLMDGDNYYLHRRSRSLPPQVIDGEP